MVIYPFNGPIILNNSVFGQYGGLTGTFSNATLDIAYWQAEMQVSAYIGTLLLPTNVTGTYVYQGKRRIPTDYGYVSRLYNVNVLTQTGFSTCNLQSNDGCGFIFEDTYGYIDFKQIASVCSLAYWGWGGYGGYPSPYISAGNPYQIELTYQAGLPTGTANQPGILRALTILAQVALNDMFPGQAGLNESVGEVGIQEFRSLDYAERRADHALVKTALGDDAQSQRAKKLIDMSVKRARKVLFA